MKLTDISFVPAGFTSVMAPVGPPDPLPGPTSIDLGIIITHTIVDVEDAYSAIRRYDPTTFLLRQKLVMTDVADSYDGSGYPGSGAYVLGQGKQHENSVFVLAKAGFTSGLGDPHVGEDFWALMEFTDPANSLDDRVIHAIGSSEGTEDTTTAIYTQTMLRIIGGVAYIDVVPLDPDTNEPAPDLDNPHAGLYGYPLTGGTDTVRSEHATSVAPPKDIGVSPDETSIYTVDESTAFSNVIYKGTIADPFNAVWFNDADIVLVWSIIAVNPDNGHVFCWAFDTDGIGVSHPVGFFVLELDEDANIIQKINVLTSSFDAAFAFPLNTCGCISNGKLYTSIYLNDNEFDPTVELADGVWVINISDGSGGEEPAFVLGETPPTDDGFFNTSIIVGIEMVGADI